MGQKWKYEPLTHEQTVLANTLSAELDISPVLCGLLVKRGITTIADAKNFFRPKLSMLHNPFLMNDMDVAVQRLNKALGKKERILVYGDYDVDGTTSVALVYKFLQQFSSNIDYYIPDRNEDGYGISKRGVDYAYSTDVKLVIVLDCGIKAIEEIAYAKELGMTVLVTDHHEIPFEDVEMVDLVYITSANVGNGRLVNGLQSQFHGNRLYGIDFRQKRHHIAAQTVRPGTDGQSDDLFRSNGLAVQLPQLFHRGIGVGKGLEIGDIFSVSVLAADPSFGPFQLKDNGFRTALGKLAAAGAENTAPASQRSVPVGTGETAVQGQLIHLTAEGFFVMVRKHFHGSVSQSIFFTIARQKGNVKNR